MAADDARFEGIVLGVGNPLLDISADVGQELLDKYGLKLNNAVLAEPAHLPLYRELVDNFKVSYIAGGATQNSIRVCQWMLQKPHATTYIGCVGKDRYAAELRAAAAADNVRVCYLEDDETPTGTCACLIKDRERSLVANLGAANKYKKEHMLSAEIAPIWHKAQFIYSAGFFLTVSPPTALHLGQHCAETNKVYMMNLSAPFISMFFSEPLLATLPYADFIFGNESEAEAFGKKMGYEDCSPRAVALQLANLPKVNGKRPRYAIITQGSHSTVVCVGQQVTEIPVPAIPAEEIVDANGAGDAFVGGFLASLAQGFSVEQSVHAGHWAAGQILRVSGTVLHGKPSFEFGAH